MKKLLSMFVSASAVLALTACGGGSDGDYNGGGGNGGGPSGPESYYRVDVSDLYQGFIIDGRNRKGEDVTLMYCGERYQYYRDRYKWIGRFSLNNDRINMYDDDGGSYRIDTDNYTLEVGVEYFIKFQNDEILVEQIRIDSHC